MARPLRLQYPGAVYHVMARGHERGAVFRDDGDRQRFLEIVGDVVDEHGWIVHGYCLMGNHFHLLVETPRGNLSAGMRSVNGRYAQFFNRRHGRRGHLFEGRFGAILVQKDEHLLELCRYIVLNPVRARLVERPEQWQWSSYGATAGHGERPAWLDVDWTLSMLARGRAAGRLRFRRFVRAGEKAASPLEAVEGQIYLGDEAFVEGMREKAAEWRDVSEIPVVQRRPRTVSIGKIRELVAREWGTSPRALSRRRGGEEKMAAMYLARKLSGLPVSGIAREFNVKPSRVSNAMTQLELSPSRRALRERLLRLRSRLMGHPPSV